jgi:septal ring factor EnvC (AmiA/AmiB activator)
MVAVSLIRHTGFAVLFFMIFRCTMARGLLEVGLVRSRCLMVKVCMVCVQLKLQQELANTQEVAMKLEAENKEAVRAMQRMRADFKNQEEAQERLAAEKLAVRRENDILKETCLHLNSELESLEARRSVVPRPNQQVHATI